MFSEKEPESDREKIRYCYLADMMEEVHVSLRDISDRLDDVYGKLHKVLVFADDLDRIYSTSATLGLSHDMALENARYALKAMNTIHLILEQSFAANKTERLKGQDD